MFKKLFCLITLLVLCSSCVSRTTTKEPGLSGENDNKFNHKTETIWFWDKDF